MSSLEWHPYFMWPPLLDLVEAKICVEFLRKQA